MYCLLIYDISDRDRLRKVAKICEDYGIRVQASCFELDITNSDLILLKKKLLTEIDLIEDRSVIERIKKQYELLGIKVIGFSKRTKEGLEEIKSEIKDKTIAFMGQTGVGKSSLINIIDPDFERKEGEYSEVLHRGKHQTKEVILLPYEGGYIIDTPGFSSLDLDISKHDLAHFFPGFSKLYTSCFYTDCLHKNEKNCKIKEEKANHLFSEETYDIYLKLLEELPFERRKY